MFRHRKKTIDGVVVPNNFSTDPRNVRRRKAYVHTGRQPGRPLKYLEPGTRREGHHLVRIQSLTRGAIVHRYVY
jgi:hypothetical protein